MPYYVIFLVSPFSLLSRALVLHIMIIMIIIKIVMVSKGSSSQNTIPNSKYSACRNPHFCLFVVSFFVCSLIFIDRAVSDGATQ